MWISKRTDYATRAVLALAMEERGLKLNEIAERVDAPRSVLEQVMPTLRTAGVVRSMRGPGGGYTLNRPAGEITLERVVRLFQGQLAPIGYATRSHPDECPPMVASSLREVWVDVRDATIAILADVTFAELADRASAATRSG